MISETLWRCPVRNKFVIVATVLALVMMPCAKISAAYAKAVSQTGTSSGERSGAGIDTLWDAGIVTVASALEQEADPRCTECCKRWHGVMPRFEPLAAPAHTGKPVIVMWLYQQTWPQSTVILTGLGARSPPPPAGTAFKVFFAKTSRFLS